MNLIKCNQFHILLTVGILALSISCARTNITSRVNDEFRGQQYSRIAVIAVLSDLELQQALETKAVRSLRDVGAMGFCGSDLFFPGRVYSDSEFVSVLVDARIDGVLLIGPTGSGIETSYLPTTTTSKTKGSGAMSGTGYYSYSSSTTTSTSGGEAITKPWMSFQATLFDVATGEPAWYATANSSGNAFANFKNVVRSMGGKAVIKLKKDGLVR